MSLWCVRKQRNAPQQAPVRKLTKFALLSAGAGAYSLSLRQTGRESRVSLFAGLAIHAIGNGFSKVMIMKICHLEDRAVLSVSGPEAVSFLQGIVSLDLTSVSQGQPGFTTLLTPQGKILFEFFIQQEDDGVLIDCRNQDADNLLKRLKLYKLRADVTLSDLRESHSVCVAFDNEAPETDLPEGFQPDPRFPALGGRRIGKRAETPDATTTPDHYHAHCMRLGVPSMGFGFTSESVFLLDINYDALNAVSYKKGCFVGQEVTSRMKRKGSVRKRTLIIQGLPENANGGDEITAGSTSLGALSVVNKGIGLAIIRLDRWEASKPNPILVNDTPVSLKRPDYLDHTE